MAGEIPLVSSLHEVLSPLHFLIQIAQMENVSIGLALARLLASLYGKNDAVFSTVRIENEFNVSSSTGGPSEFLMAGHFFFPS